MKKILFLFISLIVLYLMMDYQAYYYGFGNGWLSKKIPSGYHILFAGSDLGDQGIIIEENNMNGYLVRKDEVIEIENSPKILIKKITDYFFTSHDIIVGLNDSEGNNKKIKIGIRPVNKKWKEEHYFEEVFKINKNYKHINLNKSLLYFKYFKLLKNLVLIFLIIVFIILVIKYFLFLLFKIIYKYSSKMK